MFEGRKVRNLLAEIERVGYDDAKEARKKLRQMGEAAVPALVEALADQRKDVWEAAVKVLIKIGDPDGIENAVLRMLEAGRQATGSDCDAYYEQIDRWGEVAVPGLLAALKHGNPYIRSTAAEMLGKRRSEDAVGPLIKALHDPDVCTTAAVALGQIGGSRAVAALVKMLDAWSLDLRASAASTLQKIRDWKPADARERFALLMASGEYEAVAELGTVALKPLLRTVRLKREQKSNDGPLAFCEWMMRWAPLPFLTTLAEDVKLDLQDKQLVQDAIADRMKDEAGDSGEIAAAPLEFTCPECGKTGWAGAAAQGRLAKCRTCNCVFVMGTPRSPKGRLTPWNSQVLSLLYDAKTIHEKYGVAALEPLLWELNDARIDGPIPTPYVAAGALQLVLTSSIQQISNSELRRIAVLQDAYERAPAYRYGEDWKQKLKKLDLSAIRQIAENELKARSDSSHS